MAGNTALQAWREVPFAEFSPYIPLKKLPDGAYLGQIVATVGPDQPMFRVVQNSSTAIEWDNEDNKEFVPKPVQVSYKGDNTANNVIGHVPSHVRTADGNSVANSEMRDNYRVNSGRIKVPLAVTGDVDTDDYQGGYMCVINGPGRGQIYNIHTNSKSQTKKVERGGNSAADVNVINVYLEDELRISLTEDSDVRLVANQYKDVVQMEAAINLCCGFALTPVPPEYYFLAQIRGACLVRHNHSSAISFQGGNKLNKIKVFVSTDEKVFLSDDARTATNLEQFGQDIGYVLESITDVDNNEPFMIMLDIV